MIRHCILVQVNITRGAHYVSIVDVADLQPIARDILDGELMRKTMCVNNVGVLVVYPPTNPITRHEIIGLVEAYLETIPSHIVMAHKRDIERILSNS
jgi:hypothetical protein